LAQVSKTFPATDGLVRHVEIKYKNREEEPTNGSKAYKFVERPVQRLIVIAPVDES